MIESPPSAGSTAKKLIAGGYAPTHEGVIERLGGEQFTAGAAQLLLGELRGFLSFVRGKWCGVYDVVGESASGSRIPLQWGTNFVAMLDEGQSWLPLIGGGESLAYAYSGFKRMTSGNDATKKQLDASHLSLLSHRRSGLPFRDHPRSSSVGNTVVGNIESRPSG